MAFDVVVTRVLPEAGLELLRRSEVKLWINPADAPLARAELLARLATAEGVVATLADTLDADAIAAAPRLRAVSNYAVGYNNIDIAACTQRGIGVSNTPGVLTQATAETAWALLMMAARRCGEAERHVRTGTWAGWGPMQFLGVDIIGRTLGIIGPGRIAKQVARLARGFDMKVLYYGRNRHADWDQELGATFTDLPTLLRESDFVSIHCPLTPETRHLLGPTQLALMKPTAVLVNTARGPVVDEAALARALASGQIFAAGLDVYEFEPTIHPDLLNLPNVVLLPHIGSGTQSTRSRMSVMVAEDILAMLSGRAPAHGVNPEVWAAR